MNVPPLRVAIVGAGPAGFYTADALTRSGDRPVEVDLIERLPTPFGLVRSGVAPDHPNIKRITATFARTAQRPGVRFLGHVSLGEDVSVEELREHYDAVVYAVGSPQGQQLSIPGSEAPGVHTACALVYWYNGHPEHTHHRFGLRTARRALVVGIGNVAVDTARILVRDRDALAKTDIADHALAALRASPLEEIVMIGRRGPAQAAFSPKELRELAALPELDLYISPEDAAVDVVGETLSPAAQENIALISSLAERPPSGAARRLHLRLCTSTVALEPLADGRIQASLVRNELRWDGGRVRSAPTGQVWTEAFDVVFVAIGYQGVPIVGVPLDERSGTICNVDGRVTDGPGGERRPGEYVTGWARRGPTGLIGANRPDGRSIAEAILAEVDAAGGRPDLLALLAARGVRVARFDDWQRLDAEEQRQGAEEGRPRRKLTDVEAMLRVMEV
jgi:ferredoxin--NADP+ reductase